MIRYFIIKLNTTAAAWFSWLIVHNYQVKTTPSSHETKPLLAVRFLFSFFFSKVKYINFFRYICHQILKFNL